VNYPELDVDDLAEDLVGHLEHLDLLGQQRRVRRLLQLQGQHSTAARNNLERNSEKIEENFRKSRERVRSDLLQVTLEEVEDPLVGLGQLHERPRAGAPQLREQLRVPSCSCRQTNKQQAGV
jgi:hypothetical protein